MNILLFTTHLNKGGITSYIWSLAKGLKEQGHDVHVASSGGELEVVMEVANIKQVFLNIRTKSELDPRLYLAAVSLYFYIKKYKIQIIHAQTRVTQVMAALLSRLCGIPYVTTWHGFFRPRFFRVKFPCMGWRVIAISDGVRNHLLKDFGAPADRIRLVHNGIDTNAFSQMSASEKMMIKKQWIKGNGVLIGHIGRLSDVKGQDVLIRAMKKVSAESPLTKLLIIGQGREEAPLKKLTDQLGLKEHVIFMEGIDNTADILPAFDIVVMPSRQEGLGLSIMEAQAASRAVVASNVGGIPDLIEHGKTGWLVAPEDPDALAEAILNLAKDVTTREVMGRNAREFIVARFHSSKMVKETVEVYREIVR